MIRLCFPCDRDVTADINLTDRQASSLTIPNSGSLSVSGRRNIIVYYIIFNMLLLQIVIYIIIHVQPSSEIIFKTIAFLVSDYTNIVNEWACAKRRMVSETLSQLIGRVSSAPSSSDNYRNRLGDRLVFYI